MAAKLSLLLRRSKVGCAAPAYRCQCHAFSNARNMPVVNSDYKCTNGMYFYALLEDKCKYRNKLYAPMTYIHAACLVNISIAACNIVPIQMCDSRMTHDHDLAAQHNSTSVYQLHSYLICYNEFDVLSIGASRRWTADPAWPQYPQ